MSAKPPEEQTANLPANPPDAGPSHGNDPDPREVLAELLNDGAEGEPGNNRIPLGQLIALSALHVGPLPPAEELAKYERVLPGSADRIVAMAEKEQQHRHERQAIQVRAEARDSGRGVIFAFLLGLAAIVGGTLTAIFSSAWAGSVISLAGISTLVGTFIYGTRMKYGRLTPKKDRPPAKGGSANGDES
jgi:uncharacterized membrane protein